MKIFYLILFLHFFFVNGVTLYSQNLSKNPSKAELERKVTNLGDECWKLRETYSDSSATIGKQAIFIAEKYELKNKLPKLYNYVGAVYSNYLNNQSEAIKYFNKALISSTQLKDSAEIGWAFNNLGDTYLVTGNNPLAHEYSKKSYIIFSKIKYPLGISHGYRNFGLVQLAEKKYDSAIISFNKAKEIHENINDIKGIALVLYELGETYKQKKIFKEADSLFNESYRIYQSINNTRNSARCLRGMAAIYYEQGKYEDAKKHYIEAIELNKQKHYDYGLISNYIGIALLNASQNNREEGEFYLNQATHISKKINLTSKLLEIQKAHIQFYQILGDYKKASEKYNQFLIKYDSIFSLEQFETLNEIQDKFAINQKLINEELKNKSLKNEETLYVIILGLLLVIVLVFIILVIQQRKLNKKLSEINKTKEKMFSVISHDLKSPFNSLLGFSDLILENIRKKDYKNLEKFAEIIQQTSKRSFNLLDNLLNWTRSQSGSIKYNPQPISIKHIFEELNFFFEEEANKNKIKLQFINVISEDIKGDKNLIYTILMNLISNALKYTNEGGKIEIKAIKKAFTVVIEISDNGIGISKETLEVLFDKTKQIESKKGIRNEKGTGLGLSICYEFVHILEGEITVKSELGKGSTFKITLPG